MDLDSFLNEEKAKTTKRLLTELLGKAALTLDLIPDPKTGNVTLNGITYTYANGGLAMLGYCPVCNMEVPSRKIRRLADIPDLLRRFKPGEHDCMDV